MFCLGFFLSSSSLSIINPDYYYIQLQTSLMPTTSTTSPWIHIQTTQYGGRGFFATSDIPQNTTVLDCPSPVSFSIYRRYKKDTCAFCFACDFHKACKLKLDPSHQLSLLQQYQDFQENQIYNNSSSSFSSPSTSSDTVTSNSTASLSVDKLNIDETTTSNYITTKNCQSQSQSQCESNNHNQHQSVSLISPLNFPKSCFSLPSSSKKKSPAVSSAVYASLFFCSESCKENWNKQEDPTGLISYILNLIDQTVQTTNKQQQQQKSSSSSYDTLETSNIISSSDITPEFIQKKWDVLITSLNKDMHVSLPSQLKINDTRNNSSDINPSSSLEVESKTISNMNISSSSSSPSISSSIKSILQNPLSTTPSSSSIPSPSVISTPITPNTPITPATPITPISPKVTPDSSTILNSNNTLVISKEILNDDDVTTNNNIQIKNTTTTKIDDNENLSKNALQQQQQSSSKQTKSRRNKKKNIQKIPSLSVEEHDTARLVAIIITKLYLKSFASYYSSSLSSSTVKKTTTFFEEHFNNNNKEKEKDELDYFEDLQSNELNFLKTFPDMLNSELKIYEFLIKVLPIPIILGNLLKKINNNNKEGKETTTTTREESNLLYEPQLLRNIIGREAANAFGIWQLPITLDSELLGSSIYPKASFFNHSCHHSVEKIRIGRKILFKTIRPINKGNQLYINYGMYNDMPLIERQQTLKEKWFFDCLCDKCCQEKEEEEKEEKSKHILYK